MKTIIQVGRRYLGIRKMRLNKTLHYLARQDHDRFVIVAHSNLFFGSILVGYIYYNLT
jgi:hypothetical protein